MADSLALQVMDILKRVGKKFNRKVAEIVLILVNHKGAGSLGALAGFALAIIFTWKFLRPPKRQQRISRKQLGSTSTTDSANENDNTSQSEDFQQQQNLKEVKKRDEFRSTLTLGQLVRQKLNGGRKITCQLLGVLLEESSSEELLEHATVRSSVVEVLLELSKLCDIYLMETILDDESGERVLSALESAGLFQMGGLMEDKVLFCSTENGRSSFARQLEPDWHIDTNPDIIFQLSRFIRFQLHISPTGSNISTPNVLNSTTLECYFAEEIVA